MNKTEIISFLKTESSQFEFIAEIIEKMNPSEEAIIVNLQEEYLYFCKRMDEFLKGDLK